MIDKFIIIHIFMINNICILMLLILIMKLILMQIFWRSSFFLYYWKFLIVCLIYFSIFIISVLVFTFYSDKIFGTDWSFLFWTEIQLIIIFFCIFIIIEIFLTVRISPERHNVLRIFFFLKICLNKWRYLKLSLCFYKFVMLLIRLTIILIIRCPFTKKIFWVFVIFFFNIILMLH